MKFVNELNEKGLKHINYKKITQYWKNTPLEDYEKLAPRSKGTYGEGIAKALAESYGIKVNPPEHYNGPYDLFFNGHKIEAKFSAASERNTNWQFTFNHIALNKDWEFIVFIGVNGDLQYKAVCFTRQDFIKIMEEESFIKHQQGGKNSNNDDYCCMGTNAAKLLNHPYAKPVEQWSDIYG